MSEWLKQIAIHTTDAQVYISCDTIACWHSLAYNKIITIKIFPKLIMFDGADVVILQKKFKFVH